MDSCNKNTSCIHSSQWVQYLISLMGICNNWSSSMMCMCTKINMYASLGSTFEVLWTSLNCMLDDALALNPRPFFSTCKHPRGEKGRGTHCLHMVQISNTRKHENYAYSLLEHSVQLLWRVDANTCCVRALCPLIRFDAIGHLFKDYHLYVNYL